MARATEILGRLVVYIVVVFYMLYSLFPIIWMWTMSIKPYEEYLSGSILPINPTIDNFLYLINPMGEALKALGMHRTAISIHLPLTNSLINAGFGTLLSLLIGTLAAYSISKFKTGGKFMPFFLLTLRMLPPIVIIVPIVIFFSTLGLVDTNLCMILIYALFPLPFVVWLMKSFFDEIPPEIADAARIDGCTPAKLFYKVSLPLVKHGLAVTALFIFILNWSDFLGALTLTQSKAYTLTIQLGVYKGAYGQLYGPIAALGTVATLPPLVLGILIQKYLVRGFTFGAIKG